MDQAKQLQNLIKAENLDAILIFGPANRRYLSGFTGSTGYVLLTENKQIFFADFRYKEQAQLECPSFELVSIRDSSDLFSYLNEHGLVKLGVELEVSTLSFAKELEKAGCQVVFGVDQALRELRMVKSSQELSRIRRACEITDQAFEYILTEIKVGITEAEIDFKLQSFMRSFPEVEKMAERFIVASGPRGSLPHGVASARVIQSGELITMDFGCNVEGYWSDVTRTICLGRADAKQKEVYSIVLAAQTEALRVAKAGLTGREVDQAARTVIEAAGYAQYFGHGLGHSFGLEIHESPRFAQNVEGDLYLQPGMVMTVEPGIYLPGWGGVRIEDDLIITVDGVINLTRAKKELVEIV